MHTQKKVRAVLVPLAVVFPLCFSAILAGCGGGGGGGGAAAPAGVNISGTVSAPDGISLVRSVDRSASITGVVGKGNTAVTVYRINDQGNQVGGIIASTKTDGDGKYNLSLPANVGASSSLVVSVGSGNNLMRSVVCYSTASIVVNVTPVTELVISEIVGRGQPLARYKIEDIAAIQEMIANDAEGIDLNGEASIMSIKAKLKHDTKLSSDLTTSIANASGLPLCGNGTIDTNETCDGTSLAEQSCSTQGFDSGTLSCKKDCSGFDASACVNICGDNHASLLEACDGTDLKSQTCATQGFDGGTLSCEANCTGFITA